MSVPLPGTTITRVAVIFDQASSDTPNSPRNAVVADEAFYKAIQDVSLPYLDEIKGSTIPGNEHVVFAELTQKYEERFMRSMRDLGLDEVTQVTEYDPSIVEYVEEIVANEFAYAPSDGSVFQSQSFAGSHGTETINLCIEMGNQLYLIRLRKGHLMTLSLEGVTPSPRQPSWPSRGKREHTRLGY
ncbi:hypothetical protein ANOM_005487 [Aspergillus nomiae NRRL 13137]|uniref:Uncharacterized protein n=1 Tax=Aspergillus nomiae NRRL (strain ATCC 15546 / NRRL 13137 / CBS 260.88 / M93) TaxID=1509407 RepID=A0A0L1J412_ASPN3|nr:uncharacterized protein ANOM_005487 [Aspergillus nomiae NRRL 13137]KNG86415.1 hypothetical protein ANOM_005487 [Aspergillus nomiae NRRL 13137]